MAALIPISNQDIIDQVNDYARSTTYAYRYLNQLSPGITLPAIKTAIEQKIRQRIANRANFRSQYSSFLERLRNCRIINGNNDINTPQYFHQNMVVIYLTGAPRELPKIQYFDKLITCKINNKTFHYIIRGDLGEPPEWVHIYHINLTSPAPLYTPYINTPEVRPDEPTFRPEFSQFLRTDIPRFWIWNGSHTTIGPVYSYINNNRTVNNKKPVNLVNIHNKLYRAELTDDPEFRYGVKLTKPYSINPYPKNLISIDDYISNAADTGNTKVCKDEYPFYQEESAPNIPNTPDTSKLITRITADIFNKYVRCLLNYGLSIPPTGQCVPFDENDFPTLGQPGPSRTAASRSASAVPAAPAPTPAVPAAPAPTPAASRSAPEIGQVVALQARRLVIPPPRPPAAPPAAPTSAPGRGTSSGRGRGHGQRTTPGRGRGRGQQRGGVIELDDKTSTNVTMYIKNITKIYNIKDNYECTIICDLNDLNKEAFILFEYNDSGLLFNLTTKDILENNLEKIMKKSVIPKKSSSNSSLEKSSRGSSSGQSSNKS